MRRSMLAILLAMLSVPVGAAWADIPLPKPEQAPDGLAERIELGEIEPLPPVAQAVSRAGAGRLPRGVIVETEVTRLAPVQRQTFLVTQTILDPARRLRDVEVHRPKGEGIDAHPLKVTRETVEIDGRLVDRRHYRWAVQALRGGELTLAFSRIDFEVVGRAQSEYAFVPVARRLDVTDLPPHLPAYLPVTPGLTVGNVHVGELVAGEPGSWDFQVSGEGLTAMALSRLIGAQIVAPPGLRLGEPEVHALPDGADNALPPISPLADTWQVSLSLLPSTDGGADGRRHAELPGLRLPYVDPRLAHPGAELSEVRVPPQAIGWQAEPSVQRLQWLKRAAPWLLVGLLGTVAAWLGGRQDWRLLRARRLRRAAQARLRATVDAKGLRRQLLSELAALSPPVRPASHGQLARRGASAAWLEAMAMLEAWCFAGAPAPTPAEFESVRAVLAERLPPRWFR